MKKIFLLLTILISLQAYSQADSTKYYKSWDYGWNWQRAKFRFALTLPYDTTSNKIAGSLAYLNGNWYGKNPTAWSSIADPTQFIQNQNSADQTANFRINGQGQLNKILFSGWTSDPTGANGMFGYNTVTNKAKAYINGVWENIATESYTQSSVRTGSYVYVDTNNPFATDTRGTNSKYSLTVPWKTINAAFGAMVTGDILYVRSGTYNESVNISNVVNNLWLPGSIILDNCTINGGTSYGMSFIEGSSPLSLTLINASITNTGNSSDRVNTAAITSGAVLVITGIGNSFITSTQGHGFRSAGSGISSINNVIITSTNGNGIYNDGTYALNVSGCNVNSTNAEGIYYGALVNLNTCTVTGGTYGVNTVNAPPNLTWTNSIITGTLNTAITSTSVGTTQTTNAVIYNCNLTGKSGILAWGLGNATFNYNWRFDNVKMTVTDGAVTAAFSLPSSSGSSSVVKTTNTISTVALYTSTYRSSSEGIKVIVESNTNVTNTSAYYGVKMGLGQTVPTSQLDVQGANGYNQLRLRTQYTPTASSDANGNSGDISVDDNYIYYKTSTGWKRAALSTF